MATDFNGLSVAPKRDRLYQYKINTSSLKEGAAVVYDSSASGQLVKAPAAAAAAGFAGLIADVLPSGGTTAGLDVNLQRDGLGLGLLKAGEAVTVGQELVIAGTDGSLRAFAVGSDDDCDIVGRAEQTKTAGATNEAILVNLDSARSVHKDNS